MAWQRKLRDVANAKRAEIFKSAKRDRFQWHMISKLFASLPERLRHDREKFPHTYSECISQFLADPPERLLSGLSFLMAA